MTSSVLTLQLEIPQFIRPIAQIGQLFRIFLKKALTTCPLSMMHTILLFCTSCNSIYFVQGHLTCHFSTITLISNPAVCTLYSFYYFLYLCTFQEFIRVSKDVIFFLFKKVCKGILAKKQDFAYLDLMQGPGK